MPFIDLVTKDTLIRTMNEIQYTNCSDDQDILRGLSEASGGRNYMSNNILVKGKSTSLSYEDIQAEKASQEKSGILFCITADNVALQIL